MTRNRKALAVGAAGFLAALGITTAALLNIDSTTGTFTTTVNGTVMTCTEPCVGETLSVSSNGTDPARAKQLIADAKDDLCNTTISGKKYFANYTAYKGARWYMGLSKLTLAQALTNNQDKAMYDDAGNNHIMQTTVSGTQYCNNMQRYIGGHWDLAFQTYSQLQTKLATQVKTDPTITIQRNP